MARIYLFPGQGSQRPGMGAGLFERFPWEVAQADEILGYRIAELCLGDDGTRLNQTRYTQPALFVVNALHFLARLVDTGQRPAVVAGHSLGEYSALYAAGVVDFATGLRLVRERAELMAASPVAGKYDQRLDRDSAAEMLARKANAAVEEAEAANETREFTAARRYGGSVKRSPRAGRAKDEGLADALATAFVKEMKGTTGRRIIRGILGSMFKSR